jgi:hypothetical protein
MGEKPGIGSGERADNASAAPPLKSVLALQWKGVRRNTGSGLCNA